MNKCRPFKPKNLDAHWDKGGVSQSGNEIHPHMHEFPEFKTKEEYGKRALELLQTEVGGDIYGHITKDGLLTRFDKRTGEFAKANPVSGVITFFKAQYPNNVERGMTYYMKQFHKDTENRYENYEAYRERYTKKAEGKK